MSDRPHPRPGSVPHAPIHLEVLSVPLDGTAITVRWLADPLGTLIHRRGDPRRQDNHGQIPCPGLCVCPPAQHALRTQWKGWAPCELWRDRPYTDWVPIVLEVTEMLRELLQGQPMRGSVWCLTRVGSGPRSKQITGHEIDRITVDELPLAFDVKPVVCRTMRTTAIGWGAVPHLPERQIVQPSIGYVPPTAAALPPSDEELAAKQAAEREALAALRAEMRRQANGGKS